MRLGGPNLTPVLLPGGELKLKFRIAATGTVLELNHSFDVMKKLKLIGEAFKIYKNSAFIKGMFNSQVTPYSLFSPLLRHTAIASEGRLMHVPVFFFALS